MLSKPDRNLCKVRLLAIRVSILDNNAEMTYAALQNRSLFHVSASKILPCLLLKYISITDLSGSENPLNLLANFEQLTNQLGLLNSTDHSK